MLAKNLLALCFASSAAAVLVDNRPKTPHKWNLTSATPHGKMRLPLTIVLRQEDPDGFASTVLNNGRLSQEEAAAYRRASNETVQLVSDWLDENDIEFQYDGMDLIRFNSTVDESQKLLNMSLSSYGFKASNDTVLRTRAYHVPDELGDHIDLIHPLTNFMAPKRDPIFEHLNLWNRDAIAMKGDAEPIPHRYALRKEQLRQEWWGQLRGHYDKQKKPETVEWEAVPYWDVDMDQLDPNEPSTEKTRDQYEEDAARLEKTGKDLRRPLKGNRGELCRGDVEPECIREQYEMPTMKDGIGRPPLERLGIAGFLTQSPSYADLALFAYKSAKELPEADMRALLKTEIFKGDKNHPPPKIGGLETGIEYQYGWALSHPHEVTNYATSMTMRQSNDNEPFLDLLDYLLNQPDDNLPSVLAVPYAEAELVVPRKYAERICRYFGLLTARGVTIIASSGDGGATGATSSEDHCANYGYNMIMASFPATCPWVTSVGGVNTEDELYPNVGSGGGFSEYFPRPFWQDNVVKDYQARLDKVFMEPHPEYVPPADHYQNNMRGTPDISAIAKRFVPAHNGKVVDWPLTGHHQNREYHRGIHTTMGSTMIVAAMALHENARRTQVGEQSLGWLNRRLYEEVDSKYIQDVKTLNTYTCTRLANSKFWGWLATPGWDAATGLGAPKGMAIFNHM